MVVKFRARFNRVNSKSEVLIECVVRHNSKQLCFSVDKRINIDKWKSGDKMFQKYLASIENELYSIESSFIKQGISYTSDDIISKYKNVSLTLKDCYDLYITATSKRNIKKDTVSSIKRTLYLLLDNIGLSLNIRDLKSGMIDKYISESGLSQSTIRVRLTTIRSFLSYCLNNGYIDSVINPNTKVKRKDGNIRYLTSSELNSIESLSYDNSKQVVLDSFILSAYTGLSFVDLYSPLMISLL